MNRIGVPFQISPANRRSQDVSELLALVSQFAERANTAELGTLLRILRRWPEVQAVMGDAALFTAIIAEFGAVLEVNNVPQNVLNHSNRMV